MTRFEPWMPFYFSEGSIGGDIERISLSKIKAFYESEMEIPKLEQLQLQKEKELAEPQGSNGIAISGQLTQNGYPLLLINPHTSFYFRGEVHVVSEEGLNAYGAVTWGQFFVYQGFNEKTGWMHTSTYTDVMDEFKETLVQNETGLFYQYGETLKPVKSSEVTLKFLKKGQLQEKSFKIHRTHHGPITHMVEGQWTASAMMWDPINALQQSFIRTKQSGYKGFRKMMDMKTNSSNNTVYADAEGNIAYFHGNFIPVRDTLFDFSKPVDGKNPATDWKGLHPVEEHITLLNPKNGWLQNCNSTPYTAALEYSPKRGEYPYYMSRDRENFRGVHAIQLLTDKKDHTVESLINLAHDPYLPAFKQLLPGLVADFERHDDKNPKLIEAIELLKNWDYRTQKSAIAMTLAHFYGMELYKNAERPKGAVGMDLIAYWGTDFPKKTKHFERVIDQLNSDFGTWKMPWGQVNRYQRLNSEIRQPFNDSLPSVAVGFASGTWGALAAYGARYDNNTKKIYGTRGNSFAAVVEFGPKVRAKSILAGGQSGDPASPHFDDQTERYNNQDWKEVAFYKEDVLKRAVKTYHPGE